MLPELVKATNECKRLTKKHERWTNGRLLKRILKKRFESFTEKSSESIAKVKELNEQEKLSRISTDFDLPEDIKKSYFEFCHSIVNLAHSQCIWDICTTQKIDRIRERSAASVEATRKLTSISLGACDLIQVPWMIPHLRNANGGELFVYPAFVLYRISNDAFALVDIYDVDITFELSRVTEEETVPSDANVIGQTWKKVNSDGFSPDRRFANNYQIPIVSYGSIQIKSKTGLNESYLISNANLAEQFADVWNSFKHSLPRIDN